MAKDYIGDLREGALGFIGVYFFNKLAGDRCEDCTGIWSLDVIPLKANLYEPDIEWNGATYNRCDQIKN